MSLMLALSAFLLQGEASDLYAKMSKAIDEAPALAGDIHARIEAGPKAVTVDGSLKLKSPNRMRLELSIADGKETRSMSLRCDGTKAVDGSAAASDAPPDLVTRFRAGMKPLGATALLFFGTPVKFDARARNDLPDLAPLVILDGFGSKGEEKVGGRNARVIDFAAAIKDGAALKVRIWIDAQTSLPLKREISGTWAGMPVKIAETTTFAADAGTKDEEFSIPAK